jgi:hypothetical protein
VWFDGLGWVPFEPTPSRGIPGAEQYTGLPAAQDTSGDSGAVDDLGETPTPTVPFGPTDDQLGALLPDEFADPTGGASGGAVADEPAGSTNWWPALALLGAAGIVAAPALIRRVRRRRRRRNPDQEIAALWSRSVASLADAGVPIRPSDTPMQTARATAERLPIVARPVSSLATVVTEANFSPEGTAGYAEPSIYGGSVLTNCASWARQIDRAVDDSVPWPTRVRRYVTDLG